MGNKRSITRRDFIKTSAVLAGAGLAAGNLTRSIAADAGPGSGASLSDVSLNLLDGKALAIDSGVSFSVPFPKGSVKKGAAFSLVAQGKRLPVQSWPLAYWPDGSIKWNGYATVVPAGVNGPVTLSTGSSADAGDLRVANDGKTVTVYTGVLKCKIRRAGKILSTRCRSPGKVSPPPDSLSASCKTGRRPSPKTLRHERNLSVRPKK